MPLSKITPFLWFHNEALEAAEFYTSIFDNSRILSPAHKYPETGTEMHGQKAGSVMTVEFELNGLKFVALNGGPHFTFNEAVSFVIDCNNQEEVDYYWEKLGAGGDEKRQQCGWLADKFGLSWQVVPSILPKLLGDSDRPKAERAMGAMMKMKKLDIAELQKAFDG